MIKKYKFYRFSNNFFFQASKPLQENRLSIKKHVRPSTARRPLSIGSDSHKSSSSIPTDPSDVSSESSCREDESSSEEEESESESTLVVKIVHHHPNGLQTSNEEQLQLASKNRLPKTSFLMPPPSLKTSSNLHPGATQLQGHKVIRLPRTTFVQLFPGKEKVPTFDQQDDTLSLPDLPSLKTSLPTLKDSPVAKKENKSINLASARSHPARSRSRKKTLVWREPLENHNATLTYRYYDFRKLTRPRKKKIKKKIKSRSPSRTRDQQKFNESKLSPKKEKHSSKTEQKIISSKKTKHVLTRQQTITSSPPKSRRPLPYEQNAPPIQHSTKTKVISNKNKLKTIGAPSTLDPTKNISKPTSQNEPSTSFRSNKSRKQKLKRIDVNEMTIGGLRDMPLGWQATPRKLLPRTPSPPSLLQRFLEHSTPQQT